MNRMNQMINELADDFSRMNKDSKFIPNGVARANTAGKILKAVAIVEFRAARRGEEANLDILEGCTKPAALEAKNVKALPNKAA